MRRRRRGRSSSSARARARPPAWRAGAGGGARHPGRGPKVNARRGSGYTAGTPGGSRVGAGGGFATMRVCFPFTRSRTMIKRSVKWLGLAAGTSFVGLALCGVGVGTAFGEDKKEDKKDDKGM